MSIFRGFTKRGGTCSIAPKSSPQQDAACRLASRCENVSAWSLHIGIDQGHAIRLANEKAVDQAEARELLAMLRNRPDLHGSKVYRSMRMSLTTQVLLAPSAV